jgi:hypothetical protein
MLSKLNWMVQSAPAGAIVVQAWLTEQGVSPQLAQKYTKNGWLQKLSAGVYVRPGKPPQWYDAVACLQDQLQLPVHLAGLTSLAYQGKSHYLQLQEKWIWLQAPPKTLFPKWFKAFPHNDPAILTCDENNSVKAGALKKNQHPQWLLVTSNKLLQDDPTDLLEIEIDGKPIQSSRTELAAFELLNAVPEKISFEHSAEVFQGLTSLSPKKVQSILNRSNAIKANRLFLFLAHYYQHPWAARVDESQINLGSGKRQIVKGGILDQRYLITVPETYKKDRESRKG